jgi:hypothetical protein
MQYMLLVITVAFISTARLQTRGHDKHIRPGPLRKESFPDLVPGLFRRSIGMKPTLVSW